MALNVEHELHERRRSVNRGVGFVLVGFVALVFGLTVVKVLSLDSLVQFERADHVYRPQIDPEVQAAMEAAAATEADAAAPAAEAGE